jgi:16S rRNA (adenine1518-N6/adenine1519-N6)-dimethyltransferase
LSNFNNYEIIFDDFLNRDIIKDINFDYDHLYVVANLPYYITTPIIEKITLSSLDVELMRVMVQKEVGDRFTASVGTKSYSSLSVFFDYNYIVKKDFVVNRNSFFPRPNVDSLIISFYKRDSKIVVKDLDLFYRLVRDSFKFKRKTLKNNLVNYDLSIVS